LKKGVSGVWPADQFSYSVCYRIKLSFLCAFSGAVYQCDMLADVTYACLADVVLQSKLDSLPVEDTVSAEAWQPSAHDEDNDESPSELLTVTLPTTEPGLTSFYFFVPNLTRS